MLPVFWCFFSHRYLFFFLVGFCYMVFGVFSSGFCFFLFGFCSIVFGGFV